MDTLEKPMTKDQRKIANYFKVAGLSKGYYIYLFAGGVTFIGVLMAFASQLLSEISLYFDSLPDPNMAADLQGRLMMVALLFFASFLVFLTCTVLYMIVLGQRVGGPTVAICKYIKDLQEGNYDAKRELRKNDELVPIMLELKTLAQILREKQKS
jgi:hypothetical protein